ncbi:glutamine amidotransferase [Kitasatospora sp. MMS16-BH015]|uniref:gamma-glutamyl-gamma-aminobutyrate hydrolase family protein n=1 Tax=Kitasatospora sp. MMS16-BH015 TaxID=2018025 RepID=UPI000CA19ECC|nr:gamma-glutamyl-gamma-aminobutyrate hydrolase family protein [Kitasatospora sp. MMS16-BH015]AUG82138.1 glutamine amidotransferase [Kitasatospora sp. MMS16-BH015]
MTARPLVGITSYLEPAAWGVWETNAVILPGSYLDAVTRAGGIPVVLPPHGNGAGALLERLDALVLAGGADIEPSRYGAEPHERTGKPQPGRDGWELELLNEALARDLPVLGVCRGMQLLNVALGGDLIQHLPERTGDESHQIAPGTYHEQGVVISPTSRLGELLGHAAKVPCYHHQAVGRLGTGLSASAWAGDGTVEAVELPGHRFALGVQWHPEADPTDTRLFDALVLSAS